MDGETDIVMAATGWIPARVYQSPEGLMVDWTNLGQLRFTEPFFEQTVTRALRNPAQMLFRRHTSIRELEGFDRPGLLPSALIFHLSRCGSTLVSQMLAALPRNMVISEAPPLDRVLQARVHDRGVSPSQQIDWLRGMVGALGQPRSGETRLFIKLDSWHILQLPLIQEAFPEVPWIFLYREPVEVMVSHFRMRGSQMLPGALPPRIFGEDWAAVPALPLDEYGARLLARLCEAALRFLPLGGHLVNFRELPAAVFERLAPIFGGFTNEERDAMLAAARVNAKEPSLPYVDDTAEKQLTATPDIRRFVEIWLADLYEQLEAKRRSQSPQCDER